MSYCDFCKDLPDKDRHKIYHDFYYGFPISDDNALFGRFILEIFQAGLSWDLMLKKAPDFELAFDNYDIVKIANYQEDKIDELLANSKIIRNKLKIRSVIYNANQIITLQQEHGSFYNWLYAQEAKKIEEWVKVFKKKFKFVGTEIVNEFLMSIGILKGAHDENCPIFQQQIKTHQKWMKE